MSKFAVLAAFAALVTETVANASLPVTVSVTLPVTIPFEVPAGVSFRDASAEFSRKNGLGEEVAAQLTKALEAKWQDMQQESARIVQQCHSWQREFRVEPLSSWGSLPQDLRKEWIQLDCDSVVPANAPTPLLALSVMLGDKPTELKFYEGDSIVGAVKRFCDQNGVNVAANGKLLERELTRALEAMITKNTENQVNMERANMQRGRYLFAVPVSVNGEVVRLKVHEGDKLNALVSDFCKEHQVDVSVYGEALKNEVLKMMQNLEEELMSKAKAEEQQQQQNQEETKNKLFSLPVQVNGEEASIDIYDGDVLGTKVSDFCSAHGIDEGAHGNALMEAVMEKVRVLQAQDSSFLRMESARDFS